MVPDHDVAVTCWAAVVTRCGQVGDVLPGWDDLPCWHRQTVVAMVRAYRMGASPREAAAQWAVDAASFGGWRTGPWNLDGDPPTHPWIVPWAQLPAHGRSVFRLVQHMTVALSVTLDDAIPEPRMVALERPPGGVTRPVASWAP